MSYVRYTYGATILEFTALKLSFFALWIGTQKSCRPNVHHSCTSCMWKRFIHPFIHSFIRSFVHSSNFLCRITCMGCEWSCTMPMWRPRRSFRLKCQDINVLQRENNKWRRSRYCT